MFIGHFAAAFGTKGVALIPSLGWLFAACQFPDLIWPIFALAGVERFRIDPGNTAFTPLSFDYYPWSHSLLLDLVWGVALGALYFGLRRDARGAVVIAALVVSHWVLDWIMHRPDMPLAPGSDTVLGLGLWNNVAASVVVETLLYAGMLWVYLRATTARDRIGSVGLWALALLLLAIYVANIVSPPPPSVNAVAVSALGLWLFVLFAAWVDRHRAPRALVA